MPMWYSRILTPSKRSFFLFGPRGTGKTSWLRRHFSEAQWFDLLDEALYQDLLAQPGLFARLLSPDAGWVVVDEIQRLPPLLNEVHRAIEARGLRFALTGSSARKLRRGGVNLLGGRASTRYMWPLTPEELASDFDLQTALRYGTLPLVWAEAEGGRQEAQRAYVQSYLREEIQAEALVRNLPGFARFLPIAALFHGQVLNATSLARDAGVARTTVQGYLDVLEDTLIAYRLPAFEARLRVRERAHPKLYFVDPGIVRSIKRAFGPVVHEERGLLLEGLVHGLLRAYRDYRDLFDDVYYWAPTQSRLEVDFLVERAGHYVAVEVKAATQLRQEHLKGLRAIGELDGVTRRLVVYLGESDQRTSDGIEVLTFRTFCGELAGSSLFR